MALHYMFRRPIADIIDVFTLIVAEIEENGTLGVKDGLPEDRQQQTRQGKPPANQTGQDA